MNKQNNNLDKITFSHLLIRLIEGLFIGFANGLPFFQVEDLLDIFSLNKPDFKRPKKYKNYLMKHLVKGIDDNDFSHCSFIKELLFLITHRFTYVLGILIGFALFFFIPVKSLAADYPIAYYGSVMAVCVGFIFFELYRFIKSSEKKTFHIIVSSVLLLVILIGSFFLLSYSPLSDFSFDTQKKSLLILSILFFASSFLFSFSGLSMTSLLFLSGCFINVADLFRDIVYQHNSISFVAILVLSSILGVIPSLLIKRFHSFNCEKSAINIGVFLAAIYSMKDKIKEPFFTEVSTQTAQIITISMAITVSLLVPIVITLHRFPFFNKKEFKNKQEQL